MCHLLPADPDRYRGACRQLPDTCVSSYKAYDHRLPWMHRPGQVTQDAVEAVASSVCRGIKVPVHLPPGAVELPSPASFRDRAISFLTYQ